MASFEKNLRVVAFAALGGSLLNGVLMSQGIETMPGMWTSDVYKDALLGMSVGGYSGMALGATVGVAAVLAKETVVGSIQALRERFSEQQENNTNRLKM